MPSAPVFPAESFLGGPAAEVPTCLAPHPSMPFYLMASVSGAVQLYQCGFPEVLTLYRGAPGPRVNSLRFSPSGTRFGAVDEAGMLALWQFDSNVASYQPFASIPCHSKRAHDLCFLETGNLVATAGLSKGGGSDRSGGASFHLAVWDTLMAPPKSCVAVFDCHPKGATVLCYSTKSRVLWSGGKGGELCAWDMRQRRLIASVAAHDLNIRSLDVDESNGLLGMASLKVFDGNGRKEERERERERERESVCVCVCV
jgi:WD40 repeat protein